MWGLLPALVSIGFTKMPVAGDRTNALLGSPFGTTGTSRGARSTASGFPVLSFSALPAGLPISQVTTVGIQLLERNRHLAVRRR